MCLPPAVLDQCLLLCGGSWCCPLLLLAVTVVIVIKGVINGGPAGLAVLGGGCVVDERSEGTGRVKSSMA